MKYDVEKAGYILLGRCGESYARTVEIDVSSYLAEYPDGVVTLLHRRHGEETIYPVATEIVDGCLVWKPSSADTACVGDGAAEVRVTVDDVVVKSKMLCTVVEKSLTGQETDTPEASKDWVDKVLEKVGDMTEVKAEAESVEYGQPAKAEYDKETGTLKLSIPEGKPGADGQNGSQGPQGEPGKDGTDADVTAENIQSALGYVPGKTLISESYDGQIENLFPDKINVILNDFWRYGNVCLFVFQFSVSEDMTLDYGANIAKLPFTSAMRCWLNNSMKYYIDTHGQYIKLNDENIFSGSYVLSGMYITSDPAASASEAASLSLTDASFPVEAKVNEMQAKTDTLAAEDRLAALEKLMIGL